MNSSKKNLRHVKRALQTKFSKHLMQLKCAVQKTLLDSIEVVHPKELRSNEHSSSRNSGASTHPLAHARRQRRTHASYASTVGQAACPLYKTKAIT